MQNYHAISQRSETIYTRSKYDVKETYGKSRNRHRRLEGDRRRHCEASGSRGSGRGRQLQLRARKGQNASSREITSKDGKAIAVQANVARQADIERLFAEAMKAFGRLDILVNNAGIYEFCAARRHHRRALPQAVRPERPRPAPGFPGSSKAFRLRGRQHHQHQLGREHARRRRTRRSTAPRRRPSMPSPDRSPRSWAREISA